MTSYRLEEEKMAVIIQKVVGLQHEHRFYPNFAGVAKSHNFYPTPPEATRALLSVETFDGPIWEPACGQGHIAKVLEAGATDSGRPYFVMELVKTKTCELLSSKGPFASAARRIPRWARRGICRPFSHRLSSVPRAYKVNAS